MKVSELPTNYVLVRAFSNDLSSPCDFAIFQVKPSALAELQDFVEEVFKSTIASQTKFESANFFYNIEGYYKYGGAASHAAIWQAVATRNWTFIDITPDELEDLEIHDGDIGYQCLQVKPGRAIGFSAIADDTETRFETLSISFDELLSRFA
jgi:hypothetical protein